MDDSVGGGSLAWSGTQICAPRRTHIAVTQTGAGPALVFLHGIGGRARQWRMVAEAVAPSARAILWDARGYGDSPGPGAARFADFAEDLIAVLDRLGIDRVLGVGHSMGGRILIEAALAHPERFGALFLSGATAAWLRHLSPAEREEYLRQRLAMFEDGRVAPEKARAVAREVLPEGVGAEVSGALAEDFMALRQDGYGAALRASVGWDRTGDLEALTMPCELMTGALDRICPAATVEALAGRIGAERLTILPGVAHMAQLEAPDRVAELVAGFVARHAARASAMPGMAPT
jgi:pimeloyl-ACP methyl ester carboxylesterase